MNDGLKETNRGNCAFYGVVAFSIFIAPLEATAQPISSYCATEEQRVAVHDAVSNRNGAPPVIYARNLGLPELTTISGLPETTEAYGVEANPERIKDIWSSIDQWGADTQIHVVFSMGGDHVADFTTLVPITQPDDGSGFIDIYADDGDGVHGHIFLDLVKAVYAAELPGDEGATRTVSFYNKDGGLIAGIYASINGKTVDQYAVDGFTRTFDKLKDYPALCD